MNLFTQIVNIFLVLLKFQIAVIKATYDAFTRKAKSVSGEIVLITGAGHGIGKEFALQYSNLGAKVVCWDIHEANNVETVNLIKSNGGSAYGYT
jgi:all-trans-retinol dehydrogenase (NAD+)